MQKFFVEEEQIGNDIIVILGTDVNHITNVLRMQKEQLLQICVKDNMENYIVKIVEIEKEKIITQILQKLDITVESKVQIDLYQGLPKADKMELIIQKTIEIGINKIIPVDMIRCVVKLDEKEAKKKIDRWQKIAEAAAKQSKRDIIPIVENKIKIKDVINKIEEYDCFIVAYEDETEKTLKQVLKNIKNKNDYKIGILVGPEGGIDSKEIEILKENNAISVSLGKRILRTETAPITMVSNIMYELEE